jgi:hypothetical protein
MKVTFSGGCKKELRERPWSPAGAMRRRLWNAFGAPILHGRVIPPEKPAIPFAKSLSNSLTPPIP